MGHTAGHICWESYKARRAHKQCQPSIHWWADRWTGWSKDGNGSAGNEWNKHLLRDSSPEETSARVKTPHYFWSTASKHKKDNTHAPLLSLTLLHLLINNRQVGKNLHCHKLSVNNIWGHRQIWENKREPLNMPVVPPSSDVGGVVVGGARPVCAWTCRTQSQQHLHITATGLHLHVHTDTHTTQIHPNWRWRISQTWLRAWHEIVRRHDSRLHFPHETYYKLIKKRHERKKRKQAEESNVCFFFLVNIHFLEFSDIALPTFSQSFYYFDTYIFLHLLVFRKHYIFSVLPWLKPGFLLPMCRCDVCAQTRAHLPLPAIILPDSCHCPDLGQCGLHGFWSDWRIVSFHSLLKAEIKTTTLGYHCDSREDQTEAGRRGEEGWGGGRSSEPRHAGEKLEGVRAYVCVCLSSVQKPLQRFWEKSNITWQLWRLCDAIYITFSLASFKLPAENLQSTFY